MTLIWNLDHYLNLKRGIRWLKKIWQSHHVNKVILVVICPSFSQFGATCKPNSGCMIHIYYFFINNNLLSNKKWKQNKGIFNTALILLVEKKVPFWSKTADYLRKVRGSCQHKVYFLVLRMLLYLLAKLQVSSNKS